MFNRLRFFFAAKLNGLMNKTENPAESLDYAYQRQVDELQVIRSGLVQVVSARKRIELEAASLQEKADTLYRQAQRAFELGKEDLARQALERRAELSEPLRRLEAEQAEQSETEAQLNESIEKFGARLREFAIAKEIRKAQYDAAQARVRVGECLTGVSKVMTESFAALERADDQIADLKARAGALDELLASGRLDAWGPDSFQTQIEAAERESQVNAELAQIKEQLGLGAGSGPAGELPSPDPLAALQLAPVAAVERDNEIERMAEMVQVATQIHDAVERDNA